MEFLNCTKNRHDSRAREGHVEHPERCPKLLLLAYHDTNVMAIMRTLEPSYSVTPDYSTAIFFDLTIGSGEEMEVRIQYKEGRGTERRVNIRGCANPCPLAKLIGIVQDRFSKRFSAEDCGYPDRIFI